MSDPKNQPTPQEPEELELETETVADLEPDKQESEEIVGGERGRCTGCPIGAS
jgi:hypothetical protein